MNLLPWRKQQRYEDAKSRALIILVLCLSDVILVFLGQYYVQGLLAQQRQKKQLLSEKIVNLNQKKQALNREKEEQTRLKSHYLVLQNLFVSQKLFMHFFAEFNQLFPKDVALFSIKKTANKMLLHGHALSSKSIVHLVRNLEATAWVSNPLLIAIENKENKIMNNANQFNISFTLSAQHCV